MPHWWWLFPVISYRFTTVRWEAAGRRNSRRLSTQKQFAENPPVSRCVAALNLNLFWRCTARHRSYQPAPEDFSSKDVHDEGRTDITQEEFVILLLRMEDVVLFVQFTLQAKQWEAALFYSSWLHPLKPAEISDCILMNVWKIWVYIFNWFV